MLLPATESTHGDDSLGFVFCPLIQGEVEEVFFWFVLKQHQPRGHLLHYLRFVHGDFVLAVFRRFLLRKQRLDRSRKLCHAGDGLYEPAAAVQRLDDVGWAYHAVEELRGPLPFFLRHRHALNLVLEVARPGPLDALKLVAEITERMVISREVGILVGGNTGVSCRAVIMNFVVVVNVVVSVVVGCDDGSVMECWGVPGSVGGRVGSCRVG